LQFLIRNKMPKRDELARLYARVMDAAKGRRVAFRTLDIGSDKVLPYMKPQDEPNPAMGWRAIRVGLDKPGVLRMQAQALIRAADGRPLSIMFPFITEHAEFISARAHVLAQIEREAALERPVPASIEIGAMLETPSLAYAPRAFFEATDFVSIGGNDLKQFFFAADRENERVRRRYDTLNASFLGFIRQIIARCAETGTSLSFCGEDAGRPVEAICLAAIGLHSLSMRPASIGPVKSLIRQTDLTALRGVIDAECAKGSVSVRPAVMEFLAKSKG
jgi:phosphotransferase system enzyme I (PtsP)